MFGKDEFEESKVGAVCRTMEDWVGMPFDYAIVVTDPVKKVLAPHMCTYCVT